MSATTFLWIAIFAPVAGAACSFLAELPRRAAQVCIVFSGLTLASTLVAFGYYVHHGGRALESAVTFWNVAIAPSGPRGNPADRAIVGAATDFHAQFGIIADGLSISLAVTVAAICLAIQVHATSSLRGAPGARRQFWLSSLLTASGLLTLASNNLFTLLLGWGAAAALTYALVDPVSSDTVVARAARRTFLWLRIGDLALVLAVAVLWTRFAPSVAALNGPQGGEPLDPFNFATMLAGDHGVSQWHRAAIGLIPGVGPRTLLLLSGLIVLAGAVRLGLIPFGAWLLDSTNAPATATALIQPAVTTMAGGVLLARLMPLLSETPHILGALAVLGALTVVVAGARAIVETDAFKASGWMVMGGSGFVAVAVGSGGFGPGVFHLATRGWAGAALLLAIANVVAAYRTRVLAETGGALHHLRRTGLALAAASAAAGGLVFVGTFWSLGAIMDTVWRNAGTGGAHHSGWLRAVILATAVIGVFFGAAGAGRLVLLAGCGEPARRRGFQVDRLVEWGARRRIAALGLAAGAVLVGLVGLPGLRRSLLRYANPLGTSNVPVAAVAPYVVVGVACVAGFVVAYLLWAPRFVELRGVTFEMWGRARLGRMAPRISAERLTRDGVLRPAERFTRADAEGVGPAVGSSGSLMVALAGEGERLRRLASPVGPALGIAFVALMCAVTALGVFGPAAGLNR